MTKIYNIQEQMIIVKRNGFVFKRQGKGSHEIWIKGSVTISVVTGHEFKTRTFLKECERANIDLQVLDKKYYKKVYNK